VTRVYVTEVPVPIKDGTKERDEPVGGGPFYDQPIQIGYHLGYRQSGAELSLGPALRYRRDQRRGNPFA
jgi:hypothetical protein